MPYYAFNTAIPAADNDPSDDQPDMKNNNISLNSLFGVDHYSFNDTNGGYHLYGTFIAQGSASEPFATTSGVMFGKIVNGDTWPHWKNSTGSAIPLLTGRPLAANNGYTYLPGGLVMQWGILSPVSDNAINTVTFATSNVDFNSTPYYVSMQVFTPALISSSTRILTILQTKSSTDFTFYLQNTTSVAITGVLWMAIGEAIT